jgi:UDP-N-acetylglucosamine--N-acetylmuramyl-(pentapeptide) pyrophosphoryl-undecaprenol N-acetylglucosamine transferase
MRLLIAGGGTGGHIFPGLAVAQALRARPDAPDLAWVGGHRGHEDRLVPPAGIRFHRLALRSLRSVDRDVHLVLDPLRLLASFPQAVALLVRLRPAAVFTTGGYVAIPIALAAGLLRVPVVLWEGNVVPGRSVRLVARLAAVRCVSFEATCAALDGCRCFVTGTPIRALPTDRAAARRRIGLGPDERLLLVFGGSQAVRRFNAAVRDALSTLVHEWTVVHVTGDDGYAAALASREALTGADRDRYRPVPFLREEMPDHLVAADVVVGRAGSSTIAEVAAAAVPMIVVPYRHAGGHQRANAEAYARTRAAHLIDDADFDGRRLVSVLGELDAPGRLASMREAAAACARPASAAAVGDLVLAAAARGSLPGSDLIDRRSRGPAA